MGRRSSECSEEEVLRAVVEAAAELNVSVPLVRILRETSAKTVATIEVESRVAGLYRDGVIYVLDGLNPWRRAEVAGHETYHHMQALAGLELDEGDATAFGESFGQSFCRAAAARRATSRWSGRTFGISSGGLLPAAGCGGQRFRACLRRKNWRLRVCMARTALRS